MGAHLERVDDGSLSALLSGDSAVLVLAKSDCGSCAEYEEVIEQLLAQRPALQQLRWGHLVLDAPGSRQFKVANPWLRDVDVLPHTVLYRAGAIIDRFSASTKWILLERLKQHDLIPSG